MKGVATSPAPQSCEQAYRVLTHQDSAPQLQQPISRTDATRDRILRFASAGCLFFFNENLKTCVAEFVL